MEESSIREHVQGGVFQKRLIKFINVGGLSQFDVWFLFCCNLTVSDHYICLICKLSLESRNSHHDVHLQEMFRMIMASEDVKYDKKITINHNVINFELIFKRKLCSVSQKITMQQAYYYLYIVSKKSCCKICEECNYLFLGFLYKLIFQKLPIVKPRTL